MDVELALEINRMVHNKCKDVPHDIGLRIVELIADVSKSLAPHRCPVCNGNGLVPNGFYMQTSGHWSTSSITPETCRSCGGTGVVWG